MTNRQFDMCIKALTSTHHVKIKDYTFVLISRPNNIFVFAQLYKGGKSNLYTGTLVDCIDSAKEYITMTFGVED